MIISAILALYSNTWTNQEDSVTLTTGFYKIQMIGARGSNKHISIGGAAAQYRGVVTIEDRATVRVIAGSYPGQGTHGGVESGATADAGYGGGYSAVYINDVLYAMVGGGGGADINYDGLPAGGENYVFNETLGKIYLTGGPSTHNAKSEQCSSLGDTKCGGGGAGYYPGEGGTISRRQGQGGSSYMNYNGVHDYVISSGKFIIDNFDLSTHNTNGQVRIEQIKRCQGDCIMCNYDLTNKCTKCPANKHLYKQTLRDWICLDNCSQATGPVFLNQDGECQACNPGCNKCSSTEKCLECSPPFILYKNRCYPSQPKEEETNTTTEAPIIITAATHSPDNNDGAGLIGSKSLDKDKEDNTRLWIIIAACVSGVALIVIIIVVIIYKKRSKEGSAEMVEENVGGVRDTTTTTVTFENPMYLDSLELGDDPFRPDFEENQEESGVFHPKGVDSENK